MAVTLKIKRSNTPGLAPTIGQMTEGEMTMNVFDGKLFMKKNNNGVSSVIQINNNVSSTFVDVVNSTTFTIQAAFGTVIHQNVNSDANGLYNTTTGLYTVPSTGIYHITGAMKAVTQSKLYIPWGFGVHVNNTDGIWFLWHPSVSTTNGVNSNTYQYIRVGSFVKNQQLRMIASTESATIDILTATMQIYRID